MKKTGLEKIKARHAAGCGGNKQKTGRLTQKHSHKFKTSLCSKVCSGLPRRNKRENNNNKKNPLNLKIKSKVWLGSGGARF